MTCKQCGQENVEGAVFCGSCGARIEQAEALSPSKVLSDENTSSNEGETDDAQKVSKIQQFLDFAKNATFQDWIAQAKKHWKVTLCIAIALWTIFVNVCGGSGIDRQEVSNAIVKLANELVSKNNEDVGGKVKAVDVLSLDLKKAKEQWNGIAKVRFQNNAKRSKEIVLPMTVEVFPQKQGAFVQVGFKNKSSVLADLNNLVEED